MLPDVLGPRLKVVFCGTAAGHRSAQLGQYYAGVGNGFWRTLADVGLTPRQLRPEEFRQILTYGLGLTDLAKGQSGGDADLVDSGFDVAGMTDKILDHHPGVLCFVGKRAAESFLGRPVKYGLQPEAVGATSVFVAPSTSGAARRYWDPGVWRELAQLVQQG